VEDVDAIVAALRTAGTRCEVRIFWDDTHGLPGHTSECCALLASFVRQSVR